MNISKIWYFLLCLSLFSCNLRKAKSADLGYIQNIDTIQLAAQSAYTNTSLQPGDQLVITVSAPDATVAKPFNQNYDSSEYLTNTAPSGNQIANVNPTVGPTYIVDSKGEIDFPYLGKVGVQGKSIEDFRDDLKSELLRYIHDPIVTVKRTNFKITVLGEVVRPGDYIVTDGKVTLLNALGMAGDTTIYGKRDDITILRNENGGVVHKKLNIKDANFINSDYYYLKQGDVVIVNPNKTREKTARLDPNAGIYISVASIVVTILALLFK